jgi:hypothetical protein
MFNKSSVGKSTLSSELGEYRKDKSNPQPSGSPRTFLYLTFDYILLMKTSINNKYIPVFDC